MKVWEEDWTRDNDSSCSWVLSSKSAPDYRGRFARFEDYEDEPGELQGARACLAAAAPELVRALLAVEWKGVEDYDPVAACPACGGHPPLGNLPGRHEPDCALDAALRKAGVR